MKIFLGSDSLITSKNKACTVHQKKGYRQENLSKNRKLFPLLRVEWVIYKRSVTYWLAAKCLSRFSAMPSLSGYVPLVVWVLLLTFQPRGSTFPSPSSSCSLAKSRNKKMSFINAIRQSLSWRSDESGKGKIIWASLRKIFVNEHSFCCGLACLSRESRLCK